MNLSLVFLNFSLVGPAAQEIRAIFYFGFSVTHHMLVKSIFLRAFMREGTDMTALDEIKKYVGLFC